ncbi:MAG: hypothetical protein Q4E32_02415 [Bacteroidales bacterium]|nr:hypothetical protein [Bacteroidales bacterium]
MLLFLHLCKNLLKFAGVNMARIVLKDSVKADLLHKLKAENALWSYDVSGMESISDEALIEHVLLYLDIEDVNHLFYIYDFPLVKRVWRDRVATQGEMFHAVNVLYAWYYFGAKRPEAYVKAIETRHLNHFLSA